MGRSQADIVETRRWQLYPPTSAVSWISFSRRMVVSRSAPGSKRAYRPKTKGCYECSQRRISCDGTKPGCRKCAARGLQCSGFGIGYRFSQETATRSHKIGKAVQRLRADSAESQAAETSSPELPAFSVSYDCLEKNTSCDNPPSVDWGSSNDGAIFKPLNEPCDDISADSKKPGPPKHWSEALTPIALKDAQLLSFASDGQATLLKYFSNNIAQEMIAIDDQFNGWRHLVLPITFQAEPVMQAVLSASAFHIAARYGNMSLTAQVVYSKAIKELGRNSDLTKCGGLSLNYNILSILVLLVSVMINSSVDFPILYNMLARAVDAVGGEDGLGVGELPDFLRRQIRKFRVYAAPLISEKLGVEAIQNHGSQALDCLRHCSLRHPEYSLAISNIQDQIFQAFQIYLHQAAGDIDQKTSIQLVERFRRTAEAYPSGCCSAEHVLIWASYIVAAASTLPEHQSYFCHRLRKFHMGNGFTNTLKGLDVLSTVWGRSLSTRWTAMLSQTQIFIM